MPRLVSLGDRLQDFLRVIRTYSDKFLETLNSQEPEDLTDLQQPKQFPHTVRLVI